MESLDYQFFFNYFNNFKKFEPKLFDLAIIHLDRYASEFGLSEEDLILVTKVAFNQQLGFGRVRKVIKCLIPRMSVPDEVVDNVMTWVLENYNQNVSPFAKKIVLQWCIGLIEYQLINPTNTLNNYYHLFWYFLPYEIVNVPACRLIYLLSKPEDVNRSYVKQLLKTHEHFRQPKYTGAVLLLFKSYRPDYVPENIPAYAVHKAFGNLPEFIITHFSKAQEKLASCNMISKDDNGICWFNIATRNVKKNSIQLIPSIIECETFKLDGEKPLTSISNPKDLYKYLIQGNSPNNAMCLLNNTEGCFILLFGDTNLHERFSFQLYYTLYEAFFERNQLISYEEKDNLLHKLSILQNQMQQSIPVVSKFLALYITKWDGFEHEKHVYNLLHWLNFKSYNELHECILTFLYDLFISGTVETKCKIFSCIGHFTVNIITTYFCRLKNKIRLIFLDADIKWKFNEVVYKLYDYITQLSKLGWTFEKSHSLIMNTLLDINFMIIDAEEKYGLQIWKIPDFLCDSILFSSNPTCFLRIFRLFNRFPLYVKENVRKDYVNSLWHNKAFTTKNKDSVFHILSEFLINHLKQELNNIKVSLNYTNHLALSCFTYKLKETNKDKVLEEFIELAKIHCPDLLQFLIKNI